MTDGAGFVEGFDMKKPITVMNLLTENNLRFYGNYCSCQFNSLHPSNKHTNLTMPKPTCSVSDI
jgi:hypothetical protein